MSSVVWLLVEKHTYDVQMFNLAYIFVWVQTKTHAPAYSDKTIAYNFVEHIYLKDVKNLRLVLFHFDRIIDCKISTPQSV